MFWVYFAIFGKPIPWEVIGASQAPSPHCLLYAES
jgi:hypothetical protein